MPTSSTPPASGRRSQARLSAAAHHSTLMVIAEEELAEFTATATALAPQSNPFLDATPARTRAAQDMPGAWPSAEDQRTPPPPYVLKACSVPKSLFKAAKAAKAPSCSGRYGVPPSSEASSSVFSPGATPCPTSRADRQATRDRQLCPAPPTVAPPPAAEPAPEISVKERKRRQGDNAEEANAEESMPKRLKLCLVTREDVHLYLLAPVLPGRDGKLFGTVFPDPVDAMKRITFVHNDRYIVLKTLGFSSLVEFNEMLLYTVGRALRNKIRDEPAPPLTPYVLPGTFHDRVITEEWNYDACQNYVERAKRLEAGLRRWAAVPAVPMSAQTAAGRLAVTLLHLGLGKETAWKYTEVLDALKICVQVGRIDLDEAIDLLLDDMHWFNLFFPTIDKRPIEPFVV